ncbi:MAG: hypothetical protein H0T73_19560 [Ardenticatenales bacterium]|nr:hypothetical protein [Ardenticatenales bacterium]
MPLSRIAKIIESLNQPSPHLPPTTIYNEGWLLRLLLDWSQDHQPLPAPFAFAKGASWFSEASLPTPFAASSKKDPLAEGRTKADGIIGHFQVGKTGKTDFSLLPDATQFVVLEAKLFSGLAIGVSKIPFFDQAARNVACMSETLHQAKIDLATLSSLGFVVLAPESQIKKGLFEAIHGDSIYKKVGQRVQMFGGTKDIWFEEWFEPTLEKIAIQTLSWEAYISLVKQNDPQAGSDFGKFYELCLKFCE